MNLKTLGKYNKSEHVKVPPARRRRRRDKAHENVAPPPRFGQGIRAEDWHVPNSRPVWISWNRVLNI